MCKNGQFSHFFDTVAAGSCFFSLWRFGHLSLNSIKIRRNNIH